MSLFTNRRIRIEQDIITRVNRKLPGNVNIKVKVGDEVTPTDILAESEILTGQRNINLSTLLETSGPEVIKYLKRNVGQRIYKGELLAQRLGGLFNQKKEVISPSDGVITNINGQTGVLTLSLLPKRSEIPAAVIGVVEYIDQTSHEVVIKTQVTKIYGVFGTGEVREGLLLNLGGRGDLIYASKMNAQHAEHILIGGALLYKEAIADAISLGVHGIITGGINAKDYKAVVGSINHAKKIQDDVGISLIITEAFGTVPIGEDIFNTLQKSIGKFVILDGNNAQLILPSYDENCMQNIRKVQLPPYEKKSLVEFLNEPEAVQMVLGQKVRVIASPYLGEQGKIVHIDENQSLLPSGISTYLLTIETKVRKIQVPFLNVEIIE